ncbi:MAG: TetR/AcrR family transcriptional regulator [Mycolicibacterium sp.]|uniref:TetR/AcrR family transcriptional regulator n=1 Tax=Mycolicibacterium sp. TaxID=2320850 RepID=UPI000FB8F5B7|nr:TetR/AcrR family transcriptional regulator [Mycolicibacterium sp.]RUP31874.1 MAG: TetR/AcrR family transcriptional regulator [Mycolicibacterium sp.]
MDLRAIWAQDVPQLAAPDAAERERLLGAARDEFIAHGFRRAAVADIARRAKVSRQTLNRRCGDKDDMISAVLAREVLEFFTRLAPSFDLDVQIEDRVVELFVTGIRECRTNPLLAALKEYETESVSLSLLDTEHDNYQLVMSALAMGLVAESFSEKGAEQAAELLIRITATLLLAPSNAIDTTTDDECRKFAQTYFVPILNAARAVVP